jgi:hypothetical protein
LESWRRASLAKPTSIGERRLYHPANEYQDHEILPFSIRVQGYVGRYVIGLSERVSDMLPLFPVRSTGVANPREHKTEKKKKRGPRTNKGISLGPIFSYPGKNFF